jgi:hypothetical protein
MPFVKSSKQFAALCEPLFCPPLPWRAKKSCAAAGQALTVCFCSLSAHDEAILSFSADETCF